MQSKVAGKVIPSILVAILLIAIVGGVSFWVNRDQPEPIVEPNLSSEPPAPRVIEIEPLPETPPEMASEFELQGELPSISDSDPTVRVHLQLLGGDTPVEWLEGEQTIRRIVVQVANIKNGDAIYQQSPLHRQGNLDLLPAEGDLYLLDPESYDRYNAYADFLAGIQPELLVAFYRYYEPLLDQAYSELGNSIGAFRGDLINAVEMILAAPVIETNIELIRSGLSYEFRDPALEALPGIHKQLLRMGPENTRKIQAALQAFRDRIS